MTEPIHGTQPASPVESHSGIRKSLAAAQDRAQDALAHAAQKVRHATEDATLATSQALHSLKAKAEDGLDSFELTASHALEDAKAKAREAGQTANEAMHSAKEKISAGLDSASLAIQAKANQAKAKAIRDHDSSPATSAVLSAAAKAGEAVAGDRAQKAKDSK